MTAAVGGGPLFFLVPRGEPVPPHGAPGGPGGGLGSGEGPPGPPGLLGEYLYFSVQKLCVGGPLGEAETARPSPDSSSDHP